MNNANWLSRLFSTSVAVWAVSSIEVRAQVAVPGTAELGQIQQRFETIPEPKSEPLTVPNELDDGRLRPENAETLTFVVDEILIAPSSIYEPQRLRAFMQDISSGDSITVARLYDIADQITALYGNDGYILSRAYLPAQSLASGKVQIGIIEGFVDIVEIEPAGADVRGILDRTRENVIQSRPFNNRDLEHYLLIGNDQPGVSVRSFFRKSETVQGASTLLLRIEDSAARPVSGRLGIDNRGAETTGPLELDGSLTFTNLTGYYDQTRLRVVQSLDFEELTFASLNHSQLLNTEGTRLAFDGTYSKSEPGGAVLRSIEQESESFSGTLTLTHPIIRSRSRNLTGRVAIGARNTTSEQLGNTSTRDRLRTAAVGLDYDFGDAQGGVNQITTTVTKGFDTFGATDENNPLASRFDGSTDYVTLEGFASRRQDLPKGFGLTISAQGQYADGPLLSSAECGLGGEAFGRAYDSSEITGDHCLMGSAELNYLIPEQIDLLRYAQLYTFYDGGRVWNRGISSNNASLASAGGGIRFGLGDHLTGSLEVAKPLTRDVAAEDNRDPRVFFRLTGSF